MTLSVGAGTGSAAFVLIAKKHRFLRRKIRETTTTLHFTPVILCHIDRQRALTWFFTATNSPSMTWHGVEWNDSIEMDALLCLLSGSINFKFELKRST